ncbi:MAG TPA: hypothetical protein VET24_14480 [Actinomycetota bacterium]|nr:hypothetical protein [Actinomycetota bacterium]
MPDLASATADDFDPAKGEAFDARPLEGDEPFTLVLAEIQRRAGAPGFREPFSLQFLGPRSPVLPQGTYRLTHPKVGALDLFLVPIGASDAGVTYEVVFG